MSEAVADKGYHSNQTCWTWGDGRRTYVSEPDRDGTRGRAGRSEGAVYANRRRISGERGKRLMQSRGELMERSFAHCYETGGMRRPHLRGRENILKRLLIHVAGFNLGLVMRLKYGLRKPRSLSAKAAAAAAAVRAQISALVRRLGSVVAAARAIRAAIDAASRNRPVDRIGTCRSPAAA